jgi:sec-independent protein translocase protein TatA
MLIIFLVVLIIFGPKSLPKIGQAFGRGIREFKDAARGLSTDLEDEPNQRRTVTQVPPQVLPHDSTSTQSQAEQPIQQPGNTHQA